MCVGIVNVPVGGNLQCITNKLELGSWQGAQLFSSALFSQLT